MRIQHGNPATTLQQQHQQFGHHHFTDKQKKILITKNNVHITPEAFL